MVIVCRYVHLIFIILLHNIDVLFQVLEGHSDEIFSCSFNYEGDTIITGRYIIVFVCPYVLIICREQRQHVPVVEMTHEASLVT